MTQAPPRVDTYDDGERYWSEPPPELSPRCKWWVERINAGWRPGRRISSLGYYSAAEYYGVYIWEYLNVIAPLLDDHAQWRARAVSCPRCGAPAPTDGYWRPEQACKDEHGNAQHDCHPERVAAWKEKETK